MLTILFSTLIFMIILVKKIPQTIFSARRQLIHILWALCTVALVLGMIIQPKTVYSGAVTGLNLWWNIVFPSLLPFFIISELFLNLGIVHFMGILLEPLMRPLFNVPGAGSFVMAVGYTSGYPIGAMITARLRLQLLCTRAEAERLMAFTNNSSPLFMLVAVSVGMFNNPQLGPVIAIAHYTANLTLGFLLRFYARNDREALTPPPPQENLLKRAFAEMFKVLNREKRAFGKILSDAVKNSINNLLGVGGFIILFAVLIQLLTAVGFIDFLANILCLILKPFGFTSSILKALASGLIEMTIGIKLVSEASAPLHEQLMAVSMILAWSGLSIHAQAASMIAETDIRMFPFIVTRIAHTFLAALYTYFLFRFTQTLNYLTVINPTGNLQQSFSLWHGLPVSLSILGLILSFMLIVAFLVYLSKNIRFIFLRTHR